MPTRGKYPAFHALDPFFEIIQKGLAGLVDGEHFFDMMAEGLVFESLYNLPGWPTTIRGPAELMDALSGYGNNIKLLSSDGLIVHRCERAALHKARRSPESAGVFCGLGGRCGDP